MDVSLDCARMAEEEECFLREHTLSPPYKLTAALLHKIELACQLHYRVMTSGLHQSGLNWYSLELSQMLQLGCSEVTIRPFYCTSVSVPLRNAHLVEVASRYGGCFTRDLRPHSKHGLALRQAVFEIPQRAEYCHSSLG